MRKSTAFLPNTGSLSLAGRLFAAIAVVILGTVSIPALVPPPGEPRGERNRHVAVPHVPASLLMP